MQNLTIEGFQLSPQQKRVWLLQERSYNQPYLVRGIVLIEGDIDRDILEIACQKVVARQEILRTNFQALKGMTVPLQVIRDFPLFTLDYPAVVGEKLETQITTVFESLSQRLFNLESGAVLSINLLKCSSKKSYLFLALPAICADRTSLDNLVREIGVAYTNCLQSKEFADEPLQYADIAAWQTELFTGEQTEALPEYWRKQNLSDRAIAQLPYERHPVENSLFNPDFVAVNLSKNLEFFAGQNAIDMRAFFLACWQILLWRLTGQSDVAIACYCDGRNYPELEPAIGLLAKYLPIRTELDPKAKFTEIWQRVRENIAEAERWQEYFNWEEFFPDRESEQAFFPFGFDFWTPPHPYRTETISLSLQKQSTCIDRFKLKLICGDREENPELEFHYDPDLFNRYDIKRLAAQFQILLAGAIANPETEIAKLDILSPDERQQLLIDFNQTQTPAPPYSSIHQWFEAQVQQTPEKIAIVSENQSLTYQELDAKANHLAQHLISLGVVPEVIIALCVERSLQTIIGILGILKAGGAYLPLDPILPPEAIAFRLQDSQASILLTQQHLIERLPPHQARVVDIDREISAFSNASIPPYSANNLAYVIYTSGSTGKPKGVTVEHQQLLNYVNGILKQINIQNGSSFATVSTLAADLGNTAIFAALCTSGCLHIISQERATNAEAFAEYCCRHPIDYLKIVPSHLKALLTYAHPEQILPRKCLILGGEATRWNLISQVQMHAPNCQIFNHYGPTETTVGVLTYPVTSPLNSDSVPLGRPLANTQIYLLDSEHQPVPVGVPGEIYIGGDSVARGYLNRPDLTAERFIELPLDSENRCYKTGDLGRFRKEGILEFLGRVDNQIKFHGFRIELGEIETTIRQHPEVGDAVVLFREDKPSLQRLVGYVVGCKNRDNANSETEFSVEKLRAFLRPKIPEYMLPSTFVFLKEFPLTANGKIDRKSLPVPENLRPEFRGEFVAPQTEIEQAIASIWQELLQVRTVGIYDNFFEIGGHSLLLIQLHSKLRAAFESPLAVSDIFEHPTINALANYISNQERIQISGVDRAPHRLREGSDNRADLRKQLIQQQRNAKKRG